MNIRCEEQSVLHNKQHPNTSAHLPRPSVKRIERERNIVNKITQNEERNINGGGMILYQPPAYIDIRPVTFAILKQIVTKRKWILPIIPIIF